MMMNCWEFKKCGREPGGAKTGELGVCIAATQAKADGINNGKNGGRVCWYIAGTLCDGKVQGSFAQKISSCFDCDFYRKVVMEEGKNILKSKETVKNLHITE